EFSLEDIRIMMNAPHFNPKEALQGQRKLLILKKERLERILKSLDKRLKGGDIYMDNSQLFGSFTKKQMDEYKEEARVRWGHTDAYKQSQERTKHWTKEDYARVAEESKNITSSIAKLMDSGIEDSDVQK